MTKRPSQGDGSIDQRGENNRGMRYRTLSLAAKANCMMLTKGFPGGRQII